MKSSSCAFAWLSNDLASGCVNMSERKCHRFPLQQGRNVQYETPSSVGADCLHRRGADDIAAARGARHGIHQCCDDPIDIGAEPFYASDMGFFKANGLAVNTQIISNGAAVTSAVLGGWIDVANRISFRLHWHINGASTLSLSLLQDSIRVRSRLPPSWWPELLRTSRQRI